MPKVMYSHVSAVPDTYKIIMCKKKLGISLALGQIVRYFQLFLITILVNASSYLMGELFY